MSRELVLPLIEERDIDEDVIWVNAGANRQALLLPVAMQGQLSYVI